MGEEETQPHPRRAKETHRIWLALAQSVEG